MFNLKSKSRRAYAKTTLQQFQLQRQLGTLEVDKMAIGMGALTEALIQKDVLKIPESTQLAQSFRDALDTMTQLPQSEKHSEVWAQKCIAMSKEFPMNALSEKMPPLLYASYFKLNADRRASAVKKPNMNAMQDRAILTNSVIDSLSFLFSEFLVNHGSFHAH